MGFEWGMDIACGRVAPKGWSRVSPRDCEEALTRRYGEMEWQSSSSCGPWRGEITLSALRCCIGLVLTQWLSLRSLFYTYTRTRAHARTQTYTYWEQYFRPCPLPLSWAVCLSSFTFYGLSFRLVYRFPPISFASFFPGYLLGRSAVIRRDPLRIIAQPNRPNDSLPLYWPLSSDALHLLVHVEFQNKRRRLVVRSRPSIYASTIFDVLARATGNALAWPRDGIATLYFLPLLQPVFPASARRVFVLSRMVLLPLSLFAPAFVRRLFGNLRAYLFSGTTI